MTQIIGRIREKKICRINLTQQCSIRIQFDIRKNSFMNMTSDLNYTQLYSILRLKSLKKLILTHINANYVNIKHIFSYFIYF